MAFDYFSAFLIGLLGSGHCIAMCGGVAGMLTSAVHPKKAKNTQEITQEITQENIETFSSNENELTNVIPSKNITDETPTNVKQVPSPASKLSLVLTYNIGRIFTYAFIGGIVGFSGSLAAKNIGVPIAGLRMVAAIFLIFLGLYIGQWLMWLNRVEYLGKYLWSTLSPLTKYVIPVNNKRKAFGLGALWGWLPCGLVYSTLTWSMASGDLLSGATIMLFFGLGTIPALITVSLGFSRFVLLLKKPNIKKIMALFLILYGFYSLFVAYRLIF
jgi:sulfite exporter TauE/SafE